MIPDKDDQLLRQIAMDIVNNKIFTSLQIPENRQHELPMVFMPLFFGALDDFSEEEKKNIGMLYEYYSEAGPRAINGYPSFTSFTIANKKDTTTIIAYIKQYEALNNLFKG